MEIDILGKEVLQLQIMPYSSLASAPIIALKDGDVIKED